MLLVLSNSGCRRNPGISMPVVNNKIDVTPEDVPVLYIQSSGIDVTPADTIIELKDTIVELKKTIVGLRRKK